MEKLQMLSYTVKGIQAEISEVKHAIHVLESEFNRLDSEGEFDNNYNESNKTILRNEHNQLSNNLHKLEMRLEEMNKELELEKECRAD